MLIKGITVKKIYEISINYGNDEVDLSEHPFGELVYVAFVSKDDEAICDSISPDELKGLSLKYKKDKIMRDNTLFELRQRNVDC